MAQVSIEEMQQFLKPDTSLDLKQMSLDHLIGLSGSEEGIKILLEHEMLMLRIINCTYDYEEDIAGDALMLVLNISVHDKGAEELIKYKPWRKKNIVELFISYVLDHRKKAADVACMILSNLMTRTNLVYVCLDTFLTHLNSIINAFAKLHYNVKGSKLHYVAPLLASLSVSSCIRKWLIHNPQGPLVKLLPFCTYTESIVRRGGILTLIRNLSFDIEYHEVLLCSNLYLLSYILHPIMGTEQFSDEEVLKLPIPLQGIPKEKTREKNKKLRKMIIEIVRQFCVTKHGRETLRANGVHFILREYHKWEKEPPLLLACENVLDILMENESEVGGEDLSVIAVSEEKVKNPQNMNMENVSMQ